LKFEYLAKEDIHMNPSQFSLWLFGELLARQISPFELSQKSGLANVVVAHILTGRRKATVRHLTAIAHALELPLELVFEKAGLLPATPALSPAKSALIDLTRKLSDVDVAALLVLVEPVHNPAWNIAQEEA
jgi:transcriptional regulator with XRE-family HTH domain